MCTAAFSNPPRIVDIDAIVSSAAPAGCWTPPADWLLLLAMMKKNYELGATFDISIPLEKVLIPTCNPCSRTQALALVLSNLAIRRAWTWTLGTGPCLLQR